MGKHAGDRRREHAGIFPRLHGDGVHGIVHVLLNGRAQALLAALQAREIRCIALPAVRERRVRARDGIAQRDAAVLIVLPDIRAERRAEGLVDMHIQIARAGGGKPAALQQGLIAAQQRQLLLHRHGAQVACLPAQHTVTIHLKTAHNRVVADGRVRLCHGGQRIKLLLQAVRLRCGAVIPALSVIDAHECAAAAALGALLQPAVLEYERRFRHVLHTDIRI